MRTVQGHGGPSLAMEPDEDPVTDLANAIRQEVNLYTPQEAIAALERVLKELK